MAASRNRKTDIPRLILNASEVDHEVNACEQRQHVVG
jgi:hypothetical protein